MFAQLSKKSEYCSFVFFSELFGNWEPATYVEYETVSTLIFAAQSKNDEFALLCIFSWNIVSEIPMDNFCNVKTPASNEWRKIWARSISHKVWFPIDLDEHVRYDCSQMLHFCDLWKRRLLNISTLLIDHWLEWTKNVNRNGPFGHWQTFFEEHFSSEEIFK